jgi:hypothetical protein
MLAYTGHWNTSHYLAEERKRLARERVAAARDRAAHRKLDRRARLLRDLEAVDKKLKAAVKLNRGQHHLSPAQTAQATVLLRRRNRLVDALNAFVGTSQRVAPEEA